MMYFDDVYVSQPHVLSLCKPTKTVRTLVVCPLLSMIGTVCETSEAQ